jgi:hypothetical protein
MNFRCSAEELYTLFNRILQRKNPAFILASFWIENCGLQTKTGGMKSRRA